MSFVFCVAMSFVLRCNEFFPALRRTEFCFKTHCNTFWIMLQWVCIILQWILSCIMLQSVFFFTAWFSLHPVSIMLQWMFFSHIMLQYIFVQWLFPASCCNEFCLIMLQWVFFLSPCIFFPVLCCNRYISSHGVALVSRIDIIIGFFCKRAL